ncbi:M23 family metallopeptidase [Demequina flava]|uniref:M23 family metallopeptidase n=1 Tax=Demequina flava TaxID=1095025 RepID=UPI0007848C32|nr:M23 family metallopeptidase [Demequina flava]
MRSLRREFIVIAAVLLAAILGGIAVGQTGAARASISDWEDEIAEQEDAIEDTQSSIDDAEGEKASVEDEAAMLDTAIDETDTDIVETEAKLEELNDELAVLEDELAAAQAAVDAAVVEQGIVADKLEAAQAQDRAITAQIEADEERTEELETLVAAIAYQQYKGTSLNASLSIVLGAADAREFVDEYSAQQSASRVQASTLAELEEIAAVNRNRGTRQEAVREYIEELKVEADALVVELKGLREEAQAARDAVDALVVEQEAVKADLESQRATLVRQQQENDALQEQIRDQVAALYQEQKAAEAAKAAAEEGLSEAEAEAARKAAEEAAKEEAENGSSSGSSGGSSGSSGGASSGGSSFWAYPTSNVHITSSYGMRYHPVLGYWRLHAGTDFRAYCGTPIYAAASGTVAWAKYTGGFGNQVMVDHGYVGGDAVMTSYNHFSGFAVSAGQSVSRGQLLGYSGTTGTSTACHLHFEMYVNGGTVNPMSVLP